MVSMQGSCQFRKAFLGRQVKKGEKERGMVEKI